MLKTGKIVCVYVVSWLFVVYSTYGRHNWDWHWTNIVIRGANWHPLHL